MMSNKLAEIVIQFNPFSAVLFFVFETGIEAVCDNNHSLLLLNSITFAMICSCIDISLQIK